MPAPERYAVHKLIVASERRNNVEKRAKDISQAESLFSVLVGARSYDLTEAWAEAWSKGPGWRQALSVGADMMSDGVRGDLLSRLEANGWTSRGLRTKPGNRRPVKKRPAAKKLPKTRR